VSHLRHQRRLAQTLLEDARRIQHFVVDYGVVHAHAAFIEDPNNRLAMLEIGGELCAQFRAFSRQFARVERMNMR
jgi:AraC-like DNA-binding protein